MDGRYMYAVDMDERLELYWKERQRCGNCRLLHRGGRRSTMVREVCCVAKVYWKKRLEVGFRFVCAPRYIGSTLANVRRMCCAVRSAANCEPPMLQILLCWTAGRRRWKTGAQKLTNEQIVKPNLLKTVSIFCCFEKWCPVAKKLKMNLFRSSKKCMISGQWKDPHWKE